MAILAHADRLSMGNTCQLPVLTRVAYGEMRKLAEIAGSRVSFLRTAARRVKFSEGQPFPNFCAVLHNSPLVSTGCAQRGNAFELRRSAVRVQSS